ncbi:hypothetical protein BH24ACT3_BH24ACT3_01340 [soil metagenome]
MAAGQLADPAGFVDIMATYRIGGRAPAVVVSAALILGELLGGVGLLAGGPTRRRPAAVVALAVALVWSALGAQAFIRQLPLDNCGCFGVYLGQPLRWWVLVQDVEFVALALWVRKKAGLTAGRRSKREPVVRLRRAGGRGR